MAGRAVRTAARIAFLVCGLTSLVTGVPYVGLRGAELPVQSEWVIFAVALALVGFFSVTVAVLPRSWIAKACKKDRDDQQLFSAPLKLLVVFAAIFICPGARRLSRSAPLESRSTTHVFAVSDVFREDDVRSLARGHLFPACSHERGGVRRTRDHLGIRMVGLP